MSNFKITSQIPNALTLSNLFCGCCAIVCIFNNAPIDAFWFLVAAFVADALDGQAARYFGVSSPMGKELDSIADTISFAAAPTCRRGIQLWRTEPEPPTPCRPNFFSPVAIRISTISRLISSSSAISAGIDCQVPWPISGRGLKMVILLSGVMRMKLFNSISLPQAGAFSSSIRFREVANNWPALLNPINKTAPA